MYIYCPPDRWYLNGQVPSRDDPHVYTQIKSLIFAPEVDLTLTSIPVNEFSVDVITRDAIPVGSGAMLYDDMDQLWAAYRVMKSERLDRQTLRILAQSEFALLDRWTVPAEMFQSMRVTRFVEKLFEDLPTSGTLYRLDIDIDPIYNDIEVTGFCPEQTARERLQWLCLTIGAMVRQCFCERLTIVPAPDTSASVYYEDGTLIPLSDTYWKPSISEKDITRSVTITGYQGFTSSDPGDDTSLKWETAEDADGVTWWFNPVIWEFANDAAPPLTGQTVSINGVTLISGETARTVLGYLSTACFRVGEVQMDVINNGTYYPGQKVRFYTDDQTIYTGYIQSCDFQFGLQACSRLVISSDLKQVVTGTLTIKYCYGDIPLGETTGTYPANSDFDVTNPPISWYEGQGGAYVEYVPTSPRVSGETSLGNSEIIVQYVPRLPDHIEIITMPNRLTYLDGDTIDYAGLMVRAYDSNGEPWTQGGLFEDGVIPMRYLTLPEQRANLQRADRSGRQSDLNILPSIAPVSVGTYSSMTFDESHWYSTMLVKWEYLIEGGLMTVNVRLNPDGTARYFFRYIFASESPNVRFEERITRANGQVYADRFYTIGADRSYTHAGKKVYYKPVFSSNVYSDNHYIGPITDYTEMTSASPVGATAWTMVYGEIIEGDQRIPVRWHVPGSDQMLECAFSITVRARGLTEEAEP